MDDMGAPPFESDQVEIWIQRELKNGKQPDYIADELLKQWEKNQLSLGAKISAGKFCFLGGFYASLLRVLTNDLQSGRPLPWGLALQILLFIESDLSKATFDNFLIGAGRDNQLHELSAQALRQKNPDSRWRKIFNSEIQDRIAAAKENRKRLLEDLRIFRNEGMETEVRENVDKLLALFPDDPEAKTFAKHIKNRDVENVVKKLRQAYGYPAENPSDDSPKRLPALSKALRKNRKNMDLEGAYCMSIGLHEMGLYEQALEVLRWKKKEWSLREEIWEMELLVKQQLFAEALSLAQIVLKKATDPETVRAALYCSAHAYRGLEDFEQATSILRGLIEHDPNYRDAAILLLEWKDMRA